MYTFDSKKNVFFNIHLNSFKILLSNVIKMYIDADDVGIHTHAFKWLKNGKSTATVVRLIFFRINQVLHFNK